VHYEESLPENGDYSALAMVQRIALYAFFFSINFENWDPFNTEGSFSIAKLAGFVYLFTILPRINHFFRTDTLQSVLRPIWLMFGLLTFNDCLNINKQSAEFFDFSMFQNIFLLWFLINHERKDPLVLEKGMLCFALGSIALAVLFFADIGIQYSAGRVSIFGDNSNAIGLRVCISIPILVLTIVQNKLNFGKLRYLFLIPLPLMLKLLFETASRVSLLSFILIFAVGVLLYKTKNFLGKITSFIFGAAACSYCWLLFLESDTLIRRLSESYEGDLAGRERIWPLLIPLIENNPLFGVGRTGYAEYCYRVIGWFVSPHNVILEVLCYTGIVGLSLYLTFLYRVSKKGYELYRAEGWLLPLLLLFPVAGLIVSGQILIQKIGWIIFAYIAGSYLFKPESEPESVDGVDMFTAHDDSSAP
jgi:O-antigen ligase